jgi:cytochrome P450
MPRDKFYNVDRETAHILMSCEVCIVANRKQVHEHWIEKVIKNAPIVKSYTIVGDDLQIEFVDHPLRFLPQNWQEDVAIRDGMSHYTAKEMQFRVCYRPAIDEIVLSYWDNKWEEHKRVYAPALTGDALVKYLTIMQQVADNRKLLLGDKR